MIRLLSRATPTASLLLLALAAGACSSGGSGGSTSTTTTNAAAADLLVVSAGSSELFSLSGEIEEARFVAEDGTTSENVLPAPASVEFLGEGGEATWILRAALEPGVYVALELDFDALAFDAIDRAGDRGVVTASDRTRRFDIDRRLVVSDHGTDRVVLQLDLETSLTAAPGGGLDLEPDFDVVLNDPAPLELVTARYLGVDAGTGFLQMERRGEGSAGTPGDPAPWSFEVELDAQTLLEDVNGGLFPSPIAFLNSLVPGSSRLEVRGEIRHDGLVDASRIRISAYSGPGAEPVRIAGMVNRTDTAPGEFELLLHRVTEGREEAESVLESLGDPEVVRVAFDATTVFALWNGGPFASSELRAGQRVEVSFGSFVAEPFPATRIEADHQGVCFAARITDTSELPHAVTVVADHDCPPVRDGDIRDASTEVRAELDGAALTLVMRDRPTIFANMLGVGMRVKLCGVLSGDPETPVLATESLEVHPGHLIQGELSSFAPQLGTLLLSDGQFVQPFGPAVTGFPTSVVLDPGARFLQSASNATEFFDTLSGLSPTQTVDLKLKGLQSGHPEEIRAFEVKLKVRGR